MGNKYPTHMDDVIDSRDVIAAIEELESERQAILDAIEEHQETIDDCDESDSRFQAESDLRDAMQELGNWDRDNGEELASLQELARDGADYAPDWDYGETLIRDSYFREYAMEFADDIGAIPDNAQWPCTCIDWDQAARELQMDYSAIEFNGIRYWIR